ncbi:MAG: YgjV family protein [Firmicutes bacterium]|nr:YgjV family protein [Bacillota bacterium]
MDREYILIQLIGLTGTGLYFLSFQFKENRKLFRIQFFSYLFYTVHLLLLGAISGGISYIINLFRSFCLGSRWEFAKKREICLIICLLQASSLYFTWAGWISLLPVTANIATTIGGYTHNARKIRIAGMFINSPLWIIYDVIVGSWAGILDELASEASMIISVIRYGWKNLDREDS